MSLDLIPLAATVASLTAGAVSAPLLMRPFWPQPATTYLRDRIHWDQVDEDGKTVRLHGRKGGGGFRVISLTGRIYSGLTQIDLENLFKSRKNLFDSLTDGPVGLRIVSQKTHLPINTPPIAPEALAQKIDSLWHARFDDSFVATHHIVISVTSKDHLKRLDPAERAIKDHLNEYGPETLTIGDGDVSPLLSWLANQLNGFDITVPPANTLLGDRLTFANLSFDRHGSIVHSDGPSQLYQSAVGIRAWPEESTAEVINALMQIPAALKIVLRALPYDKANADITIANRAKQAKLAFLNKLISDDWQKVQEKVNAGLEGYFKTEITVYATERSREDLDKTIDRVRATLAKHHTRAVRETMLAERLWWSQFPGYEYFTRDYHLLSSNIADYTPLKAEPKGKTRSPWGPHPVRYFPTASGAPYGFIFHKAEDELLGHTLVIGPAGQGKSTLIMFLILGAMSAHPNLRSFVFDRMQGCLTPFACFGGDYLIPEADNLPLNPFLLPDSLEQRDMLRILLQMLIGLDDAEAIEAINTAIGDMMKSAPEHRQMSKQWKHMFPPKSIYLQKIKPWAVEGKYSRIFNGERDALSFTGSRLVGFDMTEMHSTPQIAAAMTFYFMYRIRQMVAKAATPHLIFVDEAGAMLQDPVFFKQTEILFREHRKLLGSVIMAAQEPNVFDHDAFRVNTALRIFLRDPAARREDYAHFRLTDEEWAFIIGKDKATERLRYAALFKRDNESVILDTSLSALGPYLRAFSSSIEDRTALLKLKERFGPKWLQEFLPL
ncbi:MAG TPA: hypothetical protein VND94_19010 [Terriglobia bacterium]|nr:hypothetical protein [Terriglobia bacterium]